MTPKSMITAAESTEARAAISAPNGAWIVSVEEEGCEPSNACGTSAFGGKADINIQHNKQTRRSIPGSPLSHMSEGQI